MDPVALVAEEPEEPADEVYNYYDGRNQDPGVQEEVQPKSSILRIAINTLKPDYILKHLDYASFKVAFRTWFQIWSSVILLLVPKTSHWLGSPAYLFQVIGFIVVSGGMTIIQSVYVTLTCGLAAVIGWLYSVIAELICARIRHHTTQEMIAKALIEEGTCTEENIALCLVAQVYTGRYLETKCSAVFAVALVLGMMMFGLSQKIHATLRLPFIIGTISLTINICFKVFFPFFAPLIVSVDVIKGLLLTLAMFLFCSIVIFPETSSCKYFKGTLKLLKQLEKATANNIKFFLTMRPSEENFVNYRNYSEDIVAVRRGIIPLEWMAVLARYEISYGRIGPGAIGEIRSCFKNLLTASASMDFFYQIVDNSQRLSRGKSLRDRNMSVVSHDHHFKLFGTINEAYKPVGDYENSRRKRLIQRRLEQEASVINILDLNSTCDVLKPFFIPYLEANHHGLKLAIEWLAAANDYRTYSIFSSEKHQQKKQDIEKKLKLYREELSVKLNGLKDHKLFETYFHGKSKDNETMLSLISQCSILTFTVYEQGRQVLKILDILLLIDSHVPKPKFYTYFTKSIFKFSLNILLSLEYEVPRTDIPQFQKYQNIQPRDPDSNPPSNRFHLFGLKVVRFYNFLLNEDLWFWFRSAILVFVCALPYFCKTTAGWYFSNRLIWIVIMCGVSTSEYTGETIYVFGAKLVYSFFGCLIGMVAWYISAGSGNGNYYSYAVVTAFLYLYMSYYRHFAIHTTLVPSILYAVSSALVMGPSWVDAKYNKIANIGSGFRVAYTRFLSVIIGLCIGFLASVIPKPKTSKVAIRMILSSVLAEVGNIYCDITSFAFQRLDNLSVHIVPRHDPITDKFRLILAKLAGLSKLRTPITHEIPMTGTWPNSKYKRLQKAISDLVSLFQLLHIILDRIEDPETWISHIINRAGWYDIDMTADLFSIVHMCSDSLRSKTPLPKVTQATVSIKHLEVLKSQWGIGKTSLTERFYLEKKSVPSLETEASELHDSMVENLDYEKLFGHDGSLNITALLFVHIIYERLDAIAIIVKSLVGERYDLTDRLLTDDLFQDYKMQ